MYSNTKDNNKSKNYLETKGYLKSFEDCSYDKDHEELCHAIYEYKVNDVTYNGSPNLLSSRSGFKQTITVKYNPDNPNEYVMDSGWSGLYIFGIIAFIGALVVFIVIKTIIRKAINSKKDNYVFNT